MTKKSYQQELQRSVELAQLAASAIMKHYYGTFEAQDKADGTPVTNADVESNQIIQEGLRTTFPLDGIVSEELADVPNQSGRVWYIDPIDGTKGFIGRSDQFAVHIGLAENNMPVMGIVYKPTTNEYYFGVKGQGAYRVHPNGNHVKLGVSQKSEIELITAKDFLLNRFGQAVINALEPTKVFVSGSEGLRVMRVAEGIANLHLPDGPYKTSTWDLCAPQIIAEEAGALVKYVDGSPIEYRGQRRLGKSFVMASNEGLYQQVVGEMYKINPNLI